MLTQDGPGVFIEVPLDVPTIFGRKRAPVRGTINGLPFRSTIATYDERFYLPVNRKLREAAGVAPGDDVAITLELDDEPRTVEVPDDLAAALSADAIARARFDALSYTHRKEFVAWLSEASRPETRRRRVEATLTLLREGRAHP